MTISPKIKAQGLEDYQWKNRILLVVDEDYNTDALTAQLEVLTADEQALKERHLIIFRVTPTSVYTLEGEMTELNAKTIYGHCTLDADFSGVVLLGKDGGVKMREPFEVVTQKIFDLIDGMPMRRSEMRKSQQK